MSSCFHLAITVSDLGAARRFYGGVLGFAEGRSTEHWVDWNCYGNQLVTHLGGAAADAGASVVDGAGVPVPHFGAVLSDKEFHELAERVADAGVVFETEPTLRYQGKPGEQWTMFFRDFSGNALEFKSFTDDAHIFQRWEQQP